MDPENSVWLLESIAADGSCVVQALERWPYRVGRDAGNDLAVDARGLSRQHAQLSVDAQGRLWLADLGSTNGTFVNRERIASPREIFPNDVIHFGNAEYRLARPNSADFENSSVDAERTMIVPAGQSLSERFVRHELQFMEFLRGRGLAAAAQPIVRADNNQIVAYELLGRCQHPELPPSPMHLFHLAAQLDREAELSEAFRSFGVAALAPKLNGLALFVNTHPKETFADSFFQAIKSLRSQPGAPDLVVEVHETAVMEVDRMRDLAARLGEIGVRFAYDDFGAGQARLNELGEVPAHFVKFDMGLIRGLHEANDRKKRVVRDLVRLVLDLGSVPLAEGVELEEEAAICREMGFALIQGYLTGRPVPVQSL